MTIIPFRTKLSTRMGETVAELKLTNLFRQTTICIRALVDTGATHLVVTPAVAEALGYDIGECLTKYMDLIVDPKQQRLIGRHSDGWYIWLGGQLARIDTSAV